MVKILWESLYYKHFYWYYILLLDWTQFSCENKCQSMYAVWCTSTHFKRFQCVSFIFELIKALLKMCKGDLIHFIKHKLIDLLKGNNDTMHFFKSNSLHVCAQQTKLLLLLVSNSLGRIWNNCIRCFIVSIISWYFIRCWVHYIDHIENCNPISRAMRFLYL